MIKNFEYRTDDDVHNNHSKFVPLKYNTSWLRRETGYLILYSAKFYYKIANFLLKPGTPNRQQKKITKRK